MIYEERFQVEIMSSVNNISSGNNVSDYRGSPKNLSTSTVSNNPNVNHQPNKKMSFSGAVKASAFPKKEQAIIFPVVEGLQVRDYVVATGDLVDPKEILFASRMSNNRVCLYFSSKNVVNDFIENHGGIQVNDIFISARKLILPAQRIILSNVSPCIPHSVVEEELKNKGLKLVSPMSFIGAGIGVDKFRHICSFRRQVFVAIDQTVNIPASILVSFEDEEYRIFISDDKVRCFRCKEEGHLASNCTAPAIDVDILQASNKRPADLLENSSEGTSLEVHRSRSDEMETETTDISQQGPELPASEENTAILTQTVTEPVPEQSPKQATRSKHVAKRQKVDPDLKCTDSYKEIEKLWQEKGAQPLDYTYFIQFFSKVKGSNKPLEVARLFTEDIDGLLELLKRIQHHVSERSVKARCRRLADSIKRALLKEGKKISSPPLSRSSSVSSLNESSSDENFSV